MDSSTIQMEKSESYNPFAGFVFLIVFVSCILLFIDYFFMFLPPWMIYVANPIAWIANWIGFTNLQIGNLINFYVVSLETYETISYLPIKLGYPAIGSIICWLLFTYLISRVGGILFLLFSLVFFIFWSIAFQMTVQYSYVAMANRFKETKNNMKEEYALRKALYISENMQNPGAFGRDQSILFKLSVRLSRLQELPNIRREIDLSESITLKVSNIHLKVKSNHLPVAVYKKFGKSQYFEFLKEGLTRLNIPFDMDELSTIKISDPRTDICFSIIKHIAIRKLLVPKIFDKNFEDLFSKSINLEVIIHKSYKELYQTLGNMPYLETSKVNGLIEAYYDRQSKILHIAIPEDIYRQNRIEMLKLLVRNKKPNFKALKQSKFVYDMSTKEFNYLQRPIVHELWHFYISHMPSFDGIPPSLEEGIVTYISMRNMRLFEAFHSLPDIDLLPKFPTSDSQLMKTRDRLDKMQKKIYQYSSIENIYREKIREATYKNELIDIPTLLDMKSATLYSRSDLDLIYAEAWALAKVLISDKKEFDNMMARFKKFRQSSREILAEDEKYWKRLLEIIKNL